MRRILLVEDDHSISEMVDHYLTKEGFGIVHAFDGEEGIRLFQQGSYDLVLLDIMLPKLNGMDFLKIIREKSNIPVLMISAKDGDVDKALGLGFGADDYIAKPFSMIELTARVKAAIRRATQYSAEEPAVNKVIWIHQLAIDVDNVSVLKNGEPLQLTSTEWQTRCAYLHQILKKCLRKNKSTVPSGMKSTLMIRTSLTYICGGSEKRLRMTPPPLNILKRYGASVIN